MKFVIYLVFTILSCTLQAQVQIETKQFIAAGLALLSGAADGVNQTLHHHYHSFKRVHPNANDQYWNPDLSWRNKYDSNIPFAKTAMVWTTDADHLTRTLNRAFLVAGITVYFAGSDRKKWYMYAIEALGLMAIRATGFHLTYSIIYR